MHTCGTAAMWAGWRSFKSRLLTPPDWFDGETLYRAGPSGGISLRMWWR